MTEGTDRRSLVTFALLAYNQERFIREAVEGAFAQTYEPLEIILSDDCSTDRTFEIIQEMAAQYSGPHRVKVVGNVINRGIIPHILMRGREAEGEIVVVAAGDDVSAPERTAKLVSSLTGTADAMAAASLVDIIDEFGTTIRQRAVRPLHESKPKIYIKTRSGANEVIQGCAAAYKREVFYLPLPDLPLDFPEDLLFSFYVNLRGKEIAFIDESLVKYRQHDQALNNHIPKREHGTLAEVRRYKFELSTINMLETFKFLANALNKFDMLELSEIEEVIKRSKSVTGWPHKSALERILSVWESIIHGDWKRVKWKIARVFGGIECYQPHRLITFLREVIR